MFYDLEYGGIFMKKLFSLIAAASLTLGIASPLTVLAEEEYPSVVMITDQGGVDDKSFNQSSWEGIVEYGEEHGLERGVSGYDYIQSNDDSDYITNLNNAVQAGYDLIYGIGFKLENAMTEVAQQYPDSNFVIVDSVIEADNVASITFKDHEAAYLAGVAAAKTTKTKKVGFVGGIEGFVIDRFEAGFVEGVKAVDDSIEIDVEYVGSFADPSKAKQIAQSMYSRGIDIIYHAAGDSGNGVFSEAKDIVTNDPSQDIWVIGVDMDQTEEGKVTIDGEERNLTLTSTTKLIGGAVKKFAEEVQASGFDASLHNYGLADGGVGITEGNLSEEVLEVINEYRDKIIAGEIDIPEKPER